MRSESELCRSGREEFQAEGTASAKAEERCGRALKEEEMGWYG